jgi:pimeloyl-ACP methyl ester carboxylesterase
MGPRQRFIQAGDVQAFAREVGEGNPLLVLLHGAEAHGSMWDPFMAGLARDRRVMALDLPGHGRSEVTEDTDCSPAGVARWFAEVLRSESVASVDVLGHSFGGVVAFNIALEVPDLVRRLVGVNVANLAWANVTFRKGAYGLMDALVAGTLDETMGRRILSEIYQKDPGSDDVVVGAAFWNEPGVRMFFSNGGAEFSRSLPVWRLRELHTPTLLIWGAKDRFFLLDEARQGALYLPDSRMVVMEDGAHSPFSDSPEMFDMAVDAFLSGTIDPRAG